MLIDEFDRAGRRLGKKPFYDDASEIIRAALCRVIRRPDIAEAESPAR